MVQNKRIFQIGICFLFSVNVLHASEVNGESSVDTESLWSPWGNWSDCSRDCGGGISYQRRECLYGTCGGMAVQYQTCNIQLCPDGSPDFRSRQCEAYNDVQYNGRVYSWMAVTELPREAECSLVCQARGHNLTETLSPHVLDGTPCRSGSRDMCLNGTGVPIGCDYGFNSTLSLDQCMICGGDNSTCKLQTRRKTASREGAGLEELWFLPKDSFSIKIVLKTRSTSLLGIKTEDGSDGINQGKSSSSGNHTVGGVEVQFGRMRNGRSTISIPGVLDKNFWITILRTHSLKRGESKDKIIFQYMTPIYYVWRVTDWTVCSRSCGSGIEEQGWTCHDKLTGELVEDSHCLKRKPDDINRSCKLHDCPATNPTPDEDNRSPKLKHCNLWSATWSECSSTCGGGVQHGSVTCQKEGPDGVDYLSEDYCDLYPKPDSVRTCNTESCPQWHFTNWTECSATCGFGYRFRTVECRNAHGVEVSGCNLPSPSRETSCSTRVVCIAQRHDDPIVHITPEYAQVLESLPSYAFSNWSSCSVSCGMGVRTREVICQLFMSHDQTFIEQPLSKCSYDEMPAKKEFCEMHPCELSSGVNTEMIETSTPATSNLESPPGEVAVTERPRLEGLHFIQEDQPVGYPTPGYQTEVVKFGVGGTKTAGVSSLSSYEIDLESESPYSVESEYTDEDASYGAVSARAERYMWRQTGFTECSLSCAGGIQESVVECVDSLTDGVVKNSRCYYSEPLERFRHMCNEQPCPPEWRVLLSSNCSHTCGSGARYPTKVICLRVTDVGTEKAFPLPDSDCEGVPRPEPTSCANFECPPFWIMNMWSSCTESCGRGTRSRMVKCKQILGNGQEVERPSTSCLSASGQLPSETEACNEIDCPPSWLTGEFSECSVTCGRGQRFRPVECVQVLANGDTDMLPSSRCDQESKPPEVKQCLLAVCFEPRIVTNTTTYIQDDTEGRVYLTVGQRATMFTKTSLIVGCQVEGLHKPDVQWLKGSAVIPRNNTMRVRVITGDSLKFVQLTVSDTGVYTCMADHLSENFYLTVVPPPQLVPEEADGDYVWTEGEWSPCTVTCGGGIKRREVLCQHRNSRGIDGFSASERCVGLPEPDDITLCNKHMCTPHWVFSEWAECSGAVCQRVGVGTTARDVGCMNGSGAYIPDEECEAVHDLVKPSNISGCRTERCIPMWHVNRWEPCTATCGECVQKRKVKCMYGNSKRKAPWKLCQRVRAAPPLKTTVDLGDCPAAQYGCTDELSYCSAVLRLNSCDHPHYRRACCASCAIVNTMT